MEMAQKQKIDTISRALDLRARPSSERLRVDISSHAARRYSDRVDFCIGKREAIGRLRYEIERHGAVISSPPHWLIESEAERERTAAYLTLGEEYVLPLASLPTDEADFRAITLIARDHGSHRIHRLRVQRSEANAKAV